jgi:hypothetical protein
MCVGGQVPLPEEGCDAAVRLGTGHGGGGGERRPAASAIVIESPCVQATRHGALMWPMAGGLWPVAAAPRCLGAAGASVLPRCRSQAAFDGAACVCVCVCVLGGGRVCSVCVCVCVCARCTRPKHPISGGALGAAARHVAAAQLRLRLLGAGGRGRQLGAGAVLQQAGEPGLLHGRGRRGARQLRWPRVGPPRAHVL